MVFKHTLLCVVTLALAFHNGHAWVVQNKGIQQAAAAALISAALATAPMPSVAHDFTGNYGDPKHPNCLREINVVAKKEALVSGTDGNPGCPADGAGKGWNLVGKVEGDSILVDFSPKGGPANLKGSWEASPTPGIRWPDGNLWSLKTSTE